MGNAELLSPTDISVIRRYVHAKYAPLPGNKRAEIVADAIRRTLRQRLPVLPQQLNERLIDELIKRCLVNEGRVVKADDVLEVCSELEARGTAGSDPEQWLTPIVSWANERVPGRWSEDQIASRLNRSASLSMEAAQPLTTASEAQPRSVRGYRAFGASALALLLIGAIVGGTLGTDRGKQLPPEQVAVQPPIAAEPVPVPVPAPDVGLPAVLRYTDINSDAVKRYLSDRGALLAEEPYFGEIVASAKAHDLHPLLLLAITGQEQGFVPKSNKQAKKIANNPFNVFHSWQEYNTNVRDSADIAAKLLAKLADSRPEGYDPFEWFNETYAEDENWSDGVRRLFNRLLEAERS